MRSKLVQLLVNSLRMLGGGIRTLVCEFDKFGGLLKLAGQISPYLHSSLKYFFPIQPPPRVHSPSPEYAMHGWVRLQ